MNLDAPTEPWLRAAGPSGGEREQRRALRRMKAVATGLLLAAALVYAIARRWQQHGAPGWVGYLAAAAEAGMVGALADWFAVTALFRHPLGLPIPHTAIIPTRKEALGRSLEQFIAANFLAEDVVRDKMSRVGVADRLGSWLAEPANAERVTGELAVAVRGAFTILRDEDVQDVLEHTILGRLSEQPWGPPAGVLLGQLVRDGSHHRLVDLAVDEAGGWLTANRATVLRVVSEQAPLWSPRFLDERVAARVYAEVLRFVREVHADPRHRTRIALDEFLARFADDLRHDPATIAAAEGVKDRLLSHPEVRHAVGAIWASTKRILLEAVDDPESQLRMRVTEGIAGLGRRLTGDPDLRAKADRWLEDAVAHLVTTYRHEITAVITDTVNRWDGAETARKIELQVGGDLQFIRINGTVVGALAGLVIYAVSTAVF